MRISAVFFFKKIITFLRLTEVAHKGTSDCFKNCSKTISSTKLETCKILEYRLLDKAWERARLEKSTKLLRKSDG